MALTIFHSPILTVGSVLLMGGVGSLVLILIPAILADRHGENRAIAIVEANILAAATGAMAGLLIGLGEQTPAGWRGALLLSLAIPLFLVIRFGRVSLPAAHRLGPGVMSAPAFLRPIGRSGSPWSLPSASSSA